jgi:hypothetical protein
MRVLAIRHIWLACLLIAASVHAETTPPPSLEAWRGWVLHGLDYRACPLIAGRVGGGEADFLCAWPGVLILGADASGANLSQHWRVDADSWVPLPGDAEYWPQQVTVDGQPAAVVDHGGPALRLTIGSHEVRARMAWHERPQALRVPAAVGVVALSVDGKPVVPVQRDGDELTLGRAVASAPEADSISLRVYRRLADGAPAELRTLIAIHVSGQAREEVIGPVLPQGFAPMALGSAWPARLDADGRLRVRVQPGDDMLVLDARATAPLTAVTAHLPAAPWPAQEIWSYASAPRLRVTVASSTVQIDPQEAGVPGDWANLPAFALADAGALAIDERSRGAAADERNRLTLAREMWLDFDGAGWFARDRVNGEMLQGWRLDAALPFTLERADAGSSRNDQALLVTRGAQPNLSGVEWRTPAVDLAAGLRIAPASASLPIAGWQSSFDSVSTTLHLPNGYKLLGAPGADRADGSWIAGWNLFGVFICAVLLLLAWRLFGPLGALPALVYLVLAHQERGAPFWSLMAVIGLALIVRALPAGRLALGAEWLRRGVLALLVLLALPFVADQLRFALHPQLENEGGFAFEDFGMADKAAPPPPPEVPKIEEQAADEPVAMSAPAPPAPPAPPASPAPSQGMGAYQHRQARAAKAAEGKLDTVTVSGSNIRRTEIETSNPVVTVDRASIARRDTIGRYSESTVVQTGGGEPGWNLGRRYELSWSGPVLPTQTVRLVIAPPWLVRALRVVLVALLAWLILRLVGPGLRARMSRAVMPALACAFALGLTGVPVQAQAQTFPTDTLLNELRARSLENPRCVPDCAALAKVEVSARGDEIRVALEAHALERVALPLPGEERTLALRGVTLDGAVQDGLARQNGRLWMVLPRGVHRVELTFVATADKVALAFPLKPMRAEFGGDGWQASGIVDEHLMTETLTLARARESGSAPTAAGEQQFAPFVRVDRSLSLALDWSAATTVTRLAPKEGGFTTTLPLLPGEHVLTPGIKVGAAGATAALGEGAALTQWNSSVDKGESLVLTAPKTGDHAEVWHVLVGPTWHVEFSGVPGVALGAEEDAHDYRNFEFHPLPGETLTLRVTHPEAAQGATRALDAVRLSHGIGERAANSTLVLTIRASQGGEQAIALPSASEVLGVSRNGEALNLRVQAGKLSLPITPGKQTFEVRFRDDAPIGMLARTPVVALGLPMANIDLALDLPADRWLLMAGGPAAGPAVLYWSELAVLLLIAFALARTRRTPLKLWQWILLGLGFSTFSWLALLLVVAWLFALDRRARAESPASEAAFNLIQIGLVALTVVALLSLVGSIEQGLLGTPDMHVTGNGSNAQALRWFADRSTDVVPGAYAISLPLWVYKLAMLAWALWLANALVGWLRDGFAAWTRGGYWRRSLKPVIDTPAIDAPPPPSVQP